MAGATGVEPANRDLESRGLPLSLRPQNLLFGFFMNSSFFAPLAVFFQFYFPLHFLFIFPRPIIDALTGAALQFY